MNVDKKLNKGNGKSSETPNSYELPWCVYYIKPIGLFSGTRWKSSNDTVPNHTLITANHQALFIYNQSYETIAYVGCL